MAPLNAQHRTRSALVAGGCFVGVLCCVAWMGCSIEKNYATLSMLFDGVPDPALKARASNAAGITEEIRATADYTLHKPFAQEQCAECHSDQLKITDRNSEMCLKCHEGEPTKHPRMHGPVAAGACLWCHAPHESAYKHLMRRPAREVCVQCHDATLLSHDRVPEHADESASCIDCHSGHGGNAALFLKEGVSRLAPQAPAPDAQTR